MGIKAIWYKGKKRIGSNPPPPGSRPAPAPNPPPPRMGEQRLKFWRDQKAAGRLGHNFESLIRDFETERTTLERLERNLKRYRSVAIGAPFLEDDELRRELVRAREEEE